MELGVAPQRRAIGTDVQRQWVCRAVGGSLRKEWEVRKGAEGSRSKMESGCGVELWCERA
jgi:hypothetical protein